MGVISFLKNLFVGKQVEKITKLEVPEEKCIVEPTKEIEDRFVEKSENVTAKEIKAKAKKTNTSESMESPTEEVKKKPRRRKPANKKPKTEE